MMESSTWDVSPLALGYSSCSDYRISVLSPVKLTLASSVSLLRMQLRRANQGLRQNGTKIELANPALELKRKTRYHILENYYTQCNAALFMCLACLSLVWDVKQNICPIVVFKSHFHSQLIWTWHFQMHDIRLDIERWKKEWLVTLLASNLVWRILKHHILIIHRRKWALYCSPFLPHKKNYAYKR